MHTAIGNFIACKKDRVLKMTTYSRNAGIPTLPEKKTHFVSRHLPRNSSRSLPRLISPIISSNLSMDLGLLMWIFDLRYPHKKFWLTAVQRTSTMMWTEILRSHTPPPMGRVVAFQKTSVLSHGPCTWKEDWGEIRVYLEIPIQFLSDSIQVGQLGAFIIILVIWPI